MQNRRRFDLLIVKRDVTQSSPWVLLYILLGGVMVKQSMPSSAFVYCPFEAPLAGIVLYCQAQEITLRFW